MTTEEEILAALKRIESLLLDVARSTGARPNYQEYRPSPPGINPQDLQTMQASPVPWQKFQSMAQNPPENLRSLQAGFERYDYPYSAQDKREQK